MAETWEAWDQEALTVAAVVAVAETAENFGSKMERDRSGPMERCLRCRTVRGRIGLMGRCPEIGMAGEGSSGKGRARLSKAGKRLEVFQCCSS